MKTIITCVGYGLALFITVSCSQPESEDPVIDTSADVREVTSEYMDELMTAYTAFVSNLSEPDRGKLISFVNSLPNKTDSKNGRTAIESVCRCLATQASCYAKGTYSDCCICWDPKTQNGACGTYFGIASCRIELKPTKTPDKKSPSPSGPTIRIYPNDLKSLIDHIEREGIGQNSGLSSVGLGDFKRLIGSL